MKTSSKMGLLALVALVATVVLAQQASRTATAEFGSHSADGQAEWNWDTNVVKLTGSTYLNVTADHVAKMTAGPMTVQLDGKLERVAMLTAVGPVKLDILTALNREGLRRKILASCSEKATYEEEKQLIELIGNAKADVTTLPEGNVEALDLSGDKISVNLKTSTVTVTKPHVTMTTEIKTEKGEQ